MPQRTLFASVNHKDPSKGQQRMGNEWWLGNSEEVSGAESREAIGTDDSA